MGGRGRTRQLSDPHESKKVWETRQLTFSTFRVSGVPRLTSSRTMFATTAPVFGAARPVLGSVARPRVSIAKAASASTASKPTRLRANKPHSDLATTRRNSSLGKRGDQLKAYGLKDFKNLPADLKSVNVGDMGDALSGDDRG